MNKRSLGIKGALLCLGAVIGSLFSPVIKKKQCAPYAHQPDEIMSVQARIEKNLGVIEQYLDQRHGEGFFRDQIQNHISRTEILNALESKEGAGIYEDYVRTL